MLNLGKVYKIKILLINMKKGAIICLLLLTINLVSAVAISEDLHLNIQTTDASGNIVTGTSEFVFNISTTSDCANVVYSNSTNLTTDTRGVISYYLEDVSLNYSEQYYLCYYRDGVLKDSSKVARTPYTFRARNITLSGVEVDTDLNMTNYNITATRGFFSFLGTFVNKITSLFVQDINASGNIDVAGNVTATRFIGDGTYLTGISSGIISYVNLTTGTYTGELTNGSLAGYKACDAICDAEFTGSHFCTEFEVATWSLKSINNEDAWVIAGGPKYVPATIPVNDCNGWTHGVAGTYLGNYWHFNSTTGGEGRALNCGSTFKLACCTY